MSTLGIENIEHTNGTTAMTVSDGGVVTFNNPPGLKTSFVSVYAQGTSGYVTGSTGDFLPLTAVYQYKGTGNSDYNTSTYKYTAPVNGIYQISLKLIVSENSVSTHYDLNVDGTNEFVFTWSNDRNASSSTSFYLNAGQVVGFRNGSNAGYYRHSATMPSNDHYTVASFCLLREL